MVAVALAIDVAAAAVEAVTGEREGSRIEGSGIVYLYKYCKK